MSNFLFQRTLIIGVGLIGSSIARALKKHQISEDIHGVDINSEVVKKCINLDILSSCKNNIEDFSFQFDLIIICSPLGSYKEIFLLLDNFVKKTTLVTDAGSTKISVIKDYNEICKNKKLINFVPSHPIAGIEKSGPEYGFAELFENRYCILTPITKTDKKIILIKKLFKQIF